MARHDKKVEKSDGENNDEGGDGHGGRPSPKTVHVLNLIPTLILITLSPSVFSHYNMTRDPLVMSKPCQLPTLQPDM